MAEFGVSLVWNVILAAVLAACVMLAGKLSFMGDRPAVTHLLWLLVLVKLVTPPLLPVPVYWAREDNVKESSTAFAKPSDPQIRQSDPNTSAADASDHIESEQTESNRVTSNIAEVSNATRAVENSPAEPHNVRDKVPSTSAPTEAASIPWGPMLLALSLLGTLVIAMRAVFVTQKVSHLINRASGASAHLQSLAASLADRMRIRIPLRVCVVSARITPLLCVRWHYVVVVLPESLASHYCDQQLSCIVTHELAHFRRKDHWCNAFSFVVCALFWWNPVAWWASREMRGAQEWCCDALVVKHSGGERHFYAQTLLRVVDFLRNDCVPVPLNATGFGNVSSLERRFKMLARNQVNPGLSWWGIAIVLAVMAVLPCFPTAAQPPTDEIIAEIADEVADDESRSATEPTRGDTTMPDAAFINPDERQSLETLVSGIQQQIERYQKQEKQDFANQLQSKLSKALKRTDKNYEAEASTQLELHVVGHYEGASAGNIYREARVRVTHGRAPVILCLVGDSRIAWKVDVEKGVDLRQIILGGLEQFIESMPDGVPVADYSRRGITKQGIPAAYQRQSSSPGSRSSYPVLAKQLREMTGLEIATFQGSYRAENDGEIVVGPQSETWRQQQAYDGVRQVYLEATREQRKALVASLSELRFPAISYAVSPDGRRSHEIGVSYGTHSVFGPVVGDFVEVTDQSEQRYLDPRGAYTPDEKFALINPGTQRRDALPWGADNPLPEISHVCAFAYDSKRDRWIVIGQTRNEYQMYAVTVKDKSWSILRALGRIDLHTLCYSPADDAYYGLALVGHGDGLELYKIDPAGVVLDKNVVKGLKGRFGPDHRPWLQLVSAEKYLIAIVIRHGHAGQHLDFGDVYSNVIDPQSASLLFTTKAIAAESVKLQRERYAIETEQGQRAAVGRLAAVPDVKTDVRVTPPKEVEATSALENPDNGHFYEVVKTEGVLWKHALAIAERRKYEGMRGYLVTITSKAENDFLARNFGSSGEAWAGGSDAASEGNWKWVCGPEADKVFYRHAEMKPDAEGYANWDKNEYHTEPNNSGGAEHYLVWNWHLGPSNKEDGLWNDWDADREVDTIIVEYSK
jgi:beta-lactamase regulating signal transducer with metallopeptidase domain